MCRPTLPLALALTLLLSACHTAPVETTTGSNPPPPAPAPMPTTACRPDAARALVGREATAANIERLRIDSGATTVRVLKPNSPATMDFREDRLNVMVDDRNFVKEVSCG